jgi:hypothetical protein
MAASSLAFFSASCRALVAARARSISFEQLASSTIQSISAVLLIIPDGYGGLLSSSLVWPMDKECNSY